MVTASFVQNFLQPCARGKQGSSRQDSAFFLSHSSRLPALAVALPTQSRASEFEVNLISPTLFHFLNANELLHLMLKRVPFSLGGRPDPFGARLMPYFHTAPLTSRKGGEKKMICTGIEPA